VAAAVIAASVVEGARVLNGDVLGPFSPHALDRGEHAALNNLADSPLGGGVLAPVPLGSLVPGFTGRQSWVGHATWTPDEYRRSVATDELMADTGSPERARAFVLSTGARFVLAGCTGSPSLPQTLRPITAQVRRFGCATVYRLR
jgi:hypothetical protein